MQDVINRIKNFDFFQNLKKESYDLIEKYSRIYKAKKGTNIMFERKECDYVYFVLSGVVSVYRMNDKGKRKIIFMLTKGSFVNEDQQGEYHSAICAQAFEDSELLCIPKDIFIQILENDVAFMKIIYSSLSSKIRRMYRQLKNGDARLDKKVASKLYKLAKDYGVPSQKGTLINLDLSVTYLSDLLGAQRESVSRALKVLIDQKLIYYEKKMFYVENMKKLSDYFKT